MGITSLLSSSEGKTLEFKRDLSSPKPILKTLVAFANTAGGTLIIGRADDGSIVGVEDVIANEERLTNLISDCIAPEAALESLGILIRYGSGCVPSNGGLILFGTEEARKRFFPDSNISCALFQGVTKSKFLGRQELDGGLFGALEQVPRFIARNTRLAAKIESIRRQDIPEYPVVAVREVLVNALACPLPTSCDTEPLHMGQTKARCADNGCFIGKRRNAGMARVQGFPSGEPPCGYLLRCAFLQWNNHCFKSAPCI